MRLSNPVNLKTSEISHWLQSPYTSVLFSGKRRSRTMRLLNYMRDLKFIATKASLVAKFLCLLHVTNNYIFSSSLVYGPSMLPTLNLTGDVLVEHVSHRLGMVAPGDVVLVRSPVDPGKNLTKRVVAMEGDKVTFFTDPTAAHFSPAVEVPKGHVWVQGDNLYASHDSRHFGPVPYALIQGKVFLRVWPPDCFGSLGG